MPNLYVDLTTAKSRLGVLGTGHDSILLTLIEAISRAVDDYCGRIFFIKTETRYYDGQNKVLVLDQDLYSVSALKTDDNDDGVYETTWAAADFILLPFSGYPKFGVTVDRRSSGSKSDLNHGIQKGIEIAGKWGWEEDVVATSATVNENPYGATDLTLTVSDGTQFKTGQTIQIGTEQLYISAISTNDLTVQRGVNGTTAGQAALGTAISIYRYPAAIVEATVLQLAYSWQRRDPAFADAGLQGSQDARVGAQRLAPIHPSVQPMLKPYRLMKATAV